MMKIPMTKTFAATRTLAALCLCAAVAVAAGCNNKPPLPKTGSSEGSSGSASSTSSPQGKIVVAETKISASDAALTAKVKNALATEAGVDTQKLEVDANSGVVVLKGKVADDATKQRIEEVAKAVPGVTWVQSQLSVAPKPS